MSATTTPLPAERRVVVIVDGDFPGPEHPEARRVIAAVSGADALIVAPVGPVAGERWVVDLSARAEQAQRRLDAWCSALTPHVRTVEIDVGDASATLAATDAQHRHRAHAVIATTTVSPRDTSPRGLASMLARWAEVGTRRPAPAFGVG